MQPAAKPDDTNYFRGDGANRSFYLPRLPREYYQGDAVVHWTLPVARRGRGWLNETSHARVREIMLHAAAREGLACPTYCLMPDHIHMVWMGLRRESDQKNAMKFLREHLGPVLRPLSFQHQAHDHVMREEQRKRNVFAKICFYIMDNACQEELVKHPKEWAFCGAVVPGYPTLHPLEEDFWPLFWKLLTAMRAPDAGTIKRPAIWKKEGDKREKANYERE
jgi:putative transposase